MIPHPTSLCESSGRDNRLIHGDVFFTGFEERSDDDRGSEGRGRFPPQGGVGGWVRLGFADEPKVEHTLILVAAKRFYETF